MRFTAGAPGEPPLESVIVASVAAPYAGPGGTLRQRSRYNVAFAELPCPYLIALYARNDYSPDILAATRAVGGGVGLGFYRCLWRALDSGEMPPLRPFVFTTDYSPSDLATMLQSGGTELLDLETLKALRDDESVIRWGLARMSRYQKLSDELIVPNLDQDSSFFYD